MKNIRYYDAEKFSTDAYEKVDEGVYRTRANDPFAGKGEPVYVTALSFEQEPELGEGDSSAFIEQYPLEDILDKFLVAVEDFFEEKNDGSSNVCYLGFSGDERGIRGLLDIIGKHVYNATVEENGQLYAELVIE